MDQDRSVELYDHTVTAEVPFAGLTKITGLQDGEYSAEDLTNLVLFLSGLIPPTRATEA